MSKKQLQYRGSRWWAPSYLEVPAGPWGPSARFQGDVVAGWKAMIDWHAQHDLNLIIADIPYAQTDRVIIGWGFHYILGFDGYPHTEDLFSAGFRQKNIEILNAIFGYAKQRGITCLTHHFNYLAPRRMACALGWAPRYDTTEADWTDGGMTMDPMKLLLPNCCWNHAGYQEFMRMCWRETCRLLPDLAGIVVTCGEANMGHFPDVGQDIYRYYSDRRYLQTTEHFVTAFRDELAKAGRTAVVRCWGIEGAPHRMPTGGPYLMKHQGFDCIDAPGDDLVQRWVRNGHDVWVEAEFYGENAGPALWANAKHQQRIGRDILASGASAYVSHLNTMFEVQAMETPSACLGYEMLHVAVRDPDQVDQPQRWEQRLAVSFGEQAGDVLSAMELTSHGVLLISRVSHRAGEGFTFGWWPAFHPRLKQGSDNLGLTGGTAPPWFRGDMVALKEYIDHLQLNPWTEGCLETVRNGRRCPMQSLHEAADDAESAVAIYDRIFPQVKPAARVEWQALRCTAALTAAHTRMFAFACEAKVWFNAVRGCVDPQAQKTLAARALAAIDACLRAGAGVREALIQFPAAHVGGIEGFARQGEIYREMVVQLQPYRRELQRLLDGDAWTLSRYELTWKSIAINEASTEHTIGDAFPLDKHKVPWPAPASGENGTQT